MNDALTTLRLFNQKAERLNGLSFTASIRANKVNCGYTFGPEGISINRDLPADEEIDAFVLTFRLFVQDNDGLSMRALQALYETLPISPELIDEVREIRRQANEYLDGNSPVVLRTHRISRREVLDVFLYGGLAHANRDKAARGFCPSCGARRMAETAALLADEVLPALPLRQWVISFPFALRFLFAARPDALARALTVIYRLLATHLARKAGFTGREAATGAVTLVQRFGSALNLNMPQGTFS